MSTVWMAAFLLAVSPGDTPPPEGSADAVETSPAARPEEPLVPFRTGVELRDAAGDTLSRWAGVEDKRAAEAAREFLVLYRELQADDKLARTQRERLRTKIRGRLMALSVQIKKLAAIQRRLARQRQPKSVDAATGDDGVLAQFGGFGGQGGMMGGGFGGPGGGMGGGGMGRPGMARDDYGDELVELIQTTIAPTTWDVNGGPGSIYYWRNQRAIVVRQMGDVHDQIGGLLEQMNRLGH